MNIKGILFFGYCFFYSLVPLHASVIIEGNAQAENESFSFPIQQTAASLNGDNFYIAADPSVSGLGQANNFALARVMRDVQKFMPLTPKTVMINTLSDQPNPLFDQGVAFLSLMQGGEVDLLSRLREHPVVVSASDLQTIYFFESILPQTITDEDGNESFSLLISLGTVQNGNFLMQNIPDATGAITNAIVGLGTGVVATSVDRGGFIFAAVTPSGGGAFGDTGSGIVPIIFGDDISQKDRANMRTVLVLTVVDGPTGSSSNPGGNRATPLDRSSEAVRISSDVASMVVTDLHFDRSLQRLFIGLQVVGGAAGTDGARSVVVGRFLESQALAVSPIAPDTVFDGALDKIVGGVGAGAAISANKVRTMFTSTALHYLIVQGGNGTPSATSRTVFALPLVSGNENAELNGTIASNDAAIVDQFFSPQQNFFAPEGRTLLEPATTPTQITTASDAAAMVGGGALVNGDITDMFIRGDAVFVSVNEPDGGQQPGIFYSQALFASSGKVKGWTAWQRVSGNVAGVTGFGLDPLRADFIFTSSSSSDVRTVRRTNWLESGGGLKSLATQVSTVLTTETSGVQGARDFPFGTPGLFNIAALALLGKDTVVLAQTGTKAGGVCVPTNVFSLLSFGQGTFDQTFPVGAINAVSVSGGDLSAIGPLQAVEIARDGAPGTNAWLFVGGIHGVGVLSNPDGSGWDPTTQLSAGFGGIVSGMSFKKIGDYAFVRKIVSDNQFLYILTDKKLDRIDLSQGNIGLGIFTPITIAEPSGITDLIDSDSFLDMVISEKFGLLATTGGLFRVGNLLDIRVANDTLILDWTLIPSSEGLGVIRQLLPFSTTGLSQDVARGIGGNIYALCAYPGNDQSRVHRFAIQPVESSSVTDETVQLFPDLYIKNIPSFAVSFGAFRTGAATDGALFFHARGKTVRNNPMLWLLPAFPELRSGVRFIGVQSGTVPLNLDEANSITSLLRDSASGSWLVGGNFGLRINE